MSLRRSLFAIGALACVLLALFMPTAWYDALPRNAGAAVPPVSGVTLLRLLLALQGVALGAVAALGWQYQRIKASLLPDSGGQRTYERDISSRTNAILLGVVTVLALALRLFRAGSDLWIDEITPLQRYGHMPALQIVGSYVSSNNHLLNTLLEKLAISAFGESEWVVRLPAILFGVATVPLVWWCSRLVLSRVASIGAALLLAVSYHHVFFSQNSRGYSAYIFFALLSARALIDGLREDTVSSWTLFVIATVLGFASLLNTGFVVAGEGVVALVAVVLVHKRGENAVPLARRVIVVFGIAAFLSVQLYAVALPEVYETITHTYAQQSTGFVLFSMEFVREVVRGLTQGFGTGLLIAAIPFLAIAAAGFVALFRRSWMLALALALPGVFTALFLIAGHLTVSPRFFLLWLPLAVITAIVAIDALAPLVAPNRIALQMRFSCGMALLLIVLSTLSLKRYYNVPKQPYRAALDYVEARRGANDLVVVMYLAESGVRYYGQRAHYPLDTNYRFVRTMPALDSVLALPGHEQVWMVSTFERALKMDLPAIDQRIQNEYELRARFDATIGDGAIAVWHEKPAHVPTAKGGA